MALSHICHNYFSLEILDVISVWLVLCYKSSICTMRVRITDPGMTLVHGRSDCLRSGRYMILRNRGSDHYGSSLVPFLGQVKSLVFCRSIRLPNLYYDLPLSITPGISRISYHCTTSYKLWWSTTLPCLCHFMGSGLFVNWEHRIVNQVRTPIQ